MQAIIYTITAVALYLVCDKALLFMEARAGRRFEHRTLVFFVMLAVSALLSFSLIRNLAGG